MKRKFMMLTVITLILCLFAFTTVCSSLNSFSTNPEYEWLTGGKKVAKGDLPGDPCISCGENFIFIPNEPNHAVKELERRGFYWGCGKETNGECYKHIRY